ncbi:2-polyprenyl-6-methoxyphenol hydroxylase-like oxidoreductase [Mycobacterium colombiense]|uniref:2-polyprenyl-6-methoxyphenol hydroxylase-like oxidoreductase n=1 Tax=Mycobacterium colombiense TaxID=339268 RepID=A0A329K7G6_9MYCO|nr:2-polyprenyl-6-methoxyphenol hydroxylase-like oxidoreductase [Mycobacterium colombiense]
MLSDFYDTVTVVERDKLPDGTFQRRGASQGHHLHQMLSRGAQHIVEFFPGLLDELEAAGAIILDSPDDPALFHLGAGDVVFCQSGRFTRSEGMVVFLASRPLLEGVIRRRVRTITNVTVIDGHDVAETLIDSNGRVMGARVVEHRTGQELALTADLLIDATGRSARIPAFLEANGYQRPPECRYTIGLTYSSQLFRLQPGALAERAVLDIPTLDRPEGAGLLAYENETAIATVIGFAGRKTPNDLPGLLDSLCKFLPDRVAAALRIGEPIGEVSTQRYPVSVWRRYDKLSRFPRGLLVMGDAVCGFNPVYGQGMTSAALQAAVLQRCLADGSDQLSLRFFRASAKRLSQMWWANRFFDFTIVPSDGWQSKPKKLTSRAMAKLYAAAATDVVITEAIFRQMHLVGQPMEFLRPSLLRRIVAGNRRRAGNE